MLNRKISFFIYTIFGLAILFGLIFFTKKLTTYQKALEEFEKCKIKGVILSLKNTGRGTYDIELSSSNKIPNLRIGWQLEKYDIQVGDSVSKDANIKIMTFYKFKNGKFEKCFDYEIGL